MFLKGRCNLLLYPVQARYWKAISASGLESDLKLLPGAIGDALGCFEFDSPMLWANLSRADCPESVDAFLSCILRIASVFQAGT